MANMQTPHSSHEHSVITKKWPVALAFSMTLIALVFVTFGKVTGVGTMKSDVPAITVAGTVEFSRADDGTIVLIHRSAEGKILRVGGDATSFLEGPLRSLARMSGASFSGGERLDVLRIRGGYVFIENKATGDQVSLNAFSQTKATALADMIEENGGNRNGS